VLDFTSSLYLGLTHPSESLAAWRSLTTGVPAALSPATGTRRLEARLATLYGCERASLSPSTLHLVWDLFGRVAAERVALYVDAGAYATLWWGAERAAGRGTPVRAFAHHDADALASMVAADRSRRRPVVVCDGMCPRCGRSAPLDRYLRVVAPGGGRVVIDDTQAVGLVGEPSPAAGPFGSGGGGTPRHLGVSDPALVAVASFAKAFGAPVAALMGSRPAVGAFESASMTRVHSSPPSAAPLLALGHALWINARAGNELRERLAALIARFRAGVAAAGLVAGGGRFPVQSVDGPGLDAVAAHEALLAAGVRTVLRSGPRGPELCFVVTATHSPADVDRAVRALADAYAPREAGVVVERGQAASSPWSRSAQRWYTRAARSSLSSAAR
jgi:8-amino-7-oxononanoate synthase